MSAGILRRGREMIGRLKSGSEEVLLTLKTYYQKKKQFPGTRDLMMIKPALIDRIYLMGGLNVALEEAIGTSPRVEILRAIDELTPPGCDYASTYEIKDLLGKRGIVVTIQAVGKNLRDLKSVLMIDSVTAGEDPIWCIRPQGRCFMREFENGKG